MIVPPVLVFIYGIILFWAQNKYRVALSSESKDSPYFLGFLFTLTCLLSMFLRIDLIKTTPPNIFAVLIPQIGTALSTTIVGLIMRHIIISYDPAYSENEKLWRMATEELKENVNTYRVAQEKLIELIDDFCKTRKKLLEDEQEASKTHVSLLSESTAAISKIGKQYPPKVEKIIKSFDNIQEKINEFFGERLQNEIEKLFSNSTLRMEELNKKFCEIAKQSFEKMETSLKGLKINVNSFNESFKLVFEEFPGLQKRLFEQTKEKLLSFQDIYLEQLADCFKKINLNSHLLHDNLSTFSSKLNECKLIVDNGFKESLSDIKCNFRTLSESIQSSSQTISNSSNKLEVHTESFEKLSHNYLNTFQKEIHEIDSIIESFIEITKNRLERIN